MAGKSSADTFSNKFYGASTEAVAGTLKFTEIQTNINLQDRIGWVLHRLEWYFSNAVMALMVNTGDYIEAALCSSDKITTLELNSPNVIDLMVLNTMFQTGVGYDRKEIPIIRDFSSLPGGGLLITPRPLFVGIRGVSLASAATVACRGYFTQKSLSDAEYVDLIDFYRIYQ